MKRKNDKPSIWRDAAEILAVILVFALLMWMFVTMVRIVFDYVGERRDVNELKADTVNLEDGAGRVTASVSVISRSMAEAPSGEENTALWAYVEGEGTPPEWWNPDEPMAVEWYADTPDDMGDIWAEYGGNMEPHPPELISPGGVDWNIESAIYGWDGHTMTGVELDLFGRIIYLEFYGTSEECMNAGIDSILNLWSSEYFGRTLFETLSATAENGALVYTTYGYAYDWDYNYTALEEIKALCLERFVEGPRYNCCFFQLYGFPAWAEPLYVIDSVYFSTFKEGT